MGLGEGARCSALGRLDEEGEGRDLVLEGVVSREECSGSFSKKV